MLDFLTSFKILLESLPDMQSTLTRRCLLFHKHQILDALREWDQRKRSGPGHIDWRTHRKLQNGKILTKMMALFFRIIMKMMLSSQANTAQTQLRETEHHQDRMTNI